MAPSEDRTALNGMGAKLFQLVLERATPRQWAKWLRVPLEHAMADGDKDLALGLLKAGADGGPGWEGYYGRTMLEAAAEGGSEEVVSIMLEAGGLDELDDVTGGDGKTALHRALAHGHTDAARVLMLAGADVTLLDSRDRSALHYAIEGGHLQLAENLIIGGARLRAEDIDGDTPLHLAAAHDDSKFVSTLLRRGARRNVGNCKRQRPIHVAIEHNNLSVAETLLKAGADPNVRYGCVKQHSPLSIARSSLAMTNILLKYGSDVRSTGGFGYTALHWAAGKDDVGVIDALVEAGADLKAQSSGVVLDGNSFKRLTPLHEAAFTHNLTGMAILLQYGADVHAKSARGLTPLHVLCKTCTNTREHSYSSAAVADLLLRWGADETITDYNGKPPEALVRGRVNNSRHLRQALINAPVDRVWRRRGLLVMFRAFPDKIRVNGGIGRTVTARARRVTGRGCRGGGVVGGRGVDILAQVVEVEDDEIFRNIVEFL